MGEFVGENGQAGWGTWCVREVVQGGVVGDGDGDGGDDGEGSHVMASRQHVEEEVVKVYCWGEVVGEIWLLLWMASKRGVKGIGVRWVDAGGVVVVRME